MMSDLDELKVDADLPPIPGTLDIHADPLRGLITVEMLADDGAGMQCDLDVAQAMQVIIAMIGACHRVCRLGERS
jgi:hypothetical protein